MLFKQVTQGIGRQFMKILGKLIEEEQKVYFDYMAIINPETDLEEAREKMGVSSSVISWEIGKQTKADKRFGGTVFGSERSQVLQFRDLLVNNNGWEYDEP
jgi:hypothetical protein